MDTEQAINIVMATDACGLEPNATVLNSLMSHSTCSVHVRIFVRDLPATSLDLGRLKIDFIQTPEALRMDGKFPKHVPSQAAFDRMAAIKYCDDWDRALIFDYDQLVVGDIAELFAMDMGKNLAAGRIWHARLADASQDWFGRSLPYLYRHCADYRFLMFGPLLNLREMRAQGTFEKLQHSQKIANTEEQIAFHVACEDRVMAIPEKYNIVPMWDGCSEDAAVLHFTGERKPWLDPAMKGAELWRQYQISWHDFCEKNFG